MSLFNLNEPVFRCKQEILDIQDLRGLWRINFKILNYTIFSGIYTQIDQVFIIWGLIAAAIFMTAQFLPISWMIQAIFWSVLTLIGTIFMVTMTWFWATVERLIWVIYCWAFLMLVGLLVTDLSIVLGWGNVLLNLCPMWLGLSAVGYFCTGLGLRSRSFCLTGIVHMLAIAVLPHVGVWQFLTTGAVMAISLMFLAEVQWDMRSPIEYSLLTVEQQQFNQQQQQLRQIALRGDF
jgi:hypothetical protein